MKNNLKRLYVAITGFCLCIGLTACAGGTPGGPAGGDQYDDLPDVTVPYVTYKVDGYVVRAFCDGTSRVYIKSEALAAVANAPECQGVTQ